MPFVCFGIAKQLLDVLASGDVDLISAETEFVHY